MIIIWIFFFLPLMFQNCLKTPTAKAIGTYAGRASFVMRSSTSAVSIRPRRRPFTSIIHSLLEGLRVLVITTDSKENETMWVCWRVGLRTSSWSAFRQLDKKNIKKTFTLRFCWALSIHFRWTCVPLTVLTRLDRLMPVRRQKHRTWTCFSLRVHIWWSSNRVIFQSMMFSASVISRMLLFWS